MIKRQITQKNMQPAGCSSNIWACPLLLSVATFRVCALNGTRLSVWGHLLYDKNSISVPFACQKPVKHFGFELPVIADISQSILSMKPAIIQSGLEQKSIIWLLTRKISSCVCFTFNPYILHCHLDSPRQKMGPARVTHTAAISSWSEAGFKSSS